MKYTLDSIKHVKTVLEEQNKGKEIQVTPEYLTDLSFLKVNNERVFYFGILTIGNNDNNVSVYDKEGIEVLSVEKNNQFIILFNHIKSVDGDGNDVETIKGQFRGYHIGIV